MRKWMWTISTCVILAIVSIAGAGLWIKANMQEIAQGLSGKDIRFTNVGIHYSPIPAIVLTDLVFREGESSIKVPQLKLYPDMGKIFSGQINLKKAVLEEPLIEATKASNTRDADRSKSTPPSMGAIPDGMLVVNQGKFVLHSANGDALRGSVTAKARKMDQRLSVQLSKASIDEIGLEFTGQVSIVSFGPLKLEIDAKEGSFNPHAVKNFLLKFGYLTEVEANNIPAIERMDAKGLKVVFNADSGDLELDAQSLNLDRVELGEVSIKLSNGGVYSANCARGVLDMKSIYHWVRQNSDGHKMVAEILAQFKLNAFAPQGAIRISSLNLRANSAKKESGQLLGAIDGGVDISSEDLIINIAAENGQEQSFTISKLSSSVTIEKGNPTVTVGRLAFKSSLGGTGDISGSFPLPIDFKQLNVKSSIDGFKIFNSTLDFHLNKYGDAKAAFDVKWDGSNFIFSTDGTFRSPGRGKRDIDLSLGILRVANVDTSSLPQPAATSSLNQPFDTRAMVSRKLSAHTFVNDFQYQGFPRLQDVDLEFRSDRDSAALHGSMSIGGVQLTGVLGLSPDQLVMTIETKGTDIDLTSFIACFSKELPVYLAGRIYLTGNFGVHGKTPRELIDGAQGEMTIVMNQGVIKQLSGLDPRLSFILDILNTAGIRTDKLDAIALNKGIISGSLQKNRLVFDKFSLVGPRLSAWGTGEFALKDNRLVLSGGVKTALGVQRRFDIDRVLEKEKT